MNFINNLGLTYKIQKAETHQIPSCLCTGSSHNLIVLQIFQIPSSPSKPLPKCHLFIKFHPFHKGYPKQHNHKQNKPTSDLQLPMSCSISIFITALNLISILFAYYMYYSSTILLLEIKLYKSNFHLLTYPKNYACHKEQSNIC